MDTKTWDKNKELTTDIRFAPENIVGSEVQYGFHNPSTEYMNAVGPGYWTAVSPAG